MATDRRIRRWTPSTVDVLAGLFLLVVIGLSPRRITGDGAEYLLVSERLAAGHGPSIPFEAARRAGVYVPELATGADEQLPPHFPLFSLSVVPVLAVTTWLGSSPVLAFGITNAILLWIGLVITRRRFGNLAAGFIALSPVIWWVDKPQVEVFTFSWILLGCALLRTPGWAACCFAVASTQNPPIGVLTLLLAADAAWSRRVERGDVWKWAVAFAIIALHPLFYVMELGRLTPLVASADLRLPAWRTLVTPLIDLNIGLVVHAPIVAVLIAYGIWTCLRSPAHRKNAIMVLATYAVFLFAFAQAPNVNSGGTPGLSRYALWLVPPSVLLIAGLELPGWRRTALAVLVGLSAAWNVAAFFPAVPEAYLDPTRLAMSVWTRYPSFENPLPEIFAERLRHRDGVNTLAATPDCSKILIQGGAWPPSCASSIAAPPGCLVDGALCYANRTRDGSYAFVRTSRRGGIRLMDMLTSAE